MLKICILFFFVLNHFYIIYTQIAKDENQLNDDDLKIFENFTESPNNNNDNCVCVPYYICDDNNEVIIDGKSLLDVRFGSEKCNNVNSEVYQVCCYLPRNVSPDEPTPKPDSRSEFTRQLTVNYQCGKSSRTIDNVNTVNAGDFPWMIQLVKMDYFFNYGFVCAGTLIHPQVVLTAAHCLTSKNPGMYKVRGGQIIKNTPGLYADIDVDSIIIHPGYYSGLLYNDIALLILHNPFFISPDILPICLSTLDEDISKMNCAVVGWGTSDTGSSETKNLQTVQMSTVPKMSCEKTLRYTRLGSGFRLHSNSFCAGGGAQHNVCVGDGGGPFVCNNGRNYVQGGIVSWGVGCGSKAIHGVFTNVAHFNKWINDQIISLDL